MADLLSCEDLMVIIRGGTVTSGVCGGMIKRLLHSSLLRYLGVGGLAFAVDFALTVGLRDLAHWPLWLAVGIGYLGGFCLNFFLQRNFSFGSSKGYSWSLIWYLLLVGFNWGATTVAMYLFEGLGLATAIGKIICTAMTTAWNYPAYRFLVFPQGGETESREGRPA